MNRFDQLERENRELRERLARLSQASRRINESLDLDAVLQHALDAACALTGARYGVLTLLDEAGRIEAVLSSAMTAEEARRIWDTPDGLRIFEYLNALAEPLRIPDLLGRLRSLGLPEFQPPASVGGVLSFLAAPVFHRGERVGNIFVADREDGDEFTPEDESTLVMFASQAALVIANARRYREEQQAKNNLETLIHTSPVGVVVFDVHTGAPVSMNREVERLLNGLRRPGESPDRPPEGLTVRRADGSEISITALPMTDSLRVAEMLRAEEVTLSVPDGRSVSVLVNSTPILTDDGAVASFIATLQDLTPLKELDRLRADFFATASRELAVPLSSIKGSAATVLSAPSALEPAEFVQFFTIVDRQADRMHELIRGLVDVAQIKTGTLSLDPTPTEVASLTDEAGRVFAAAGGRHSLDINLPEDLPWVMADSGRIVQVLGHLLADAARHSFDDSRIRVTAEREGSVYVAVSVSHESRGVAADLRPHLVTTSARVAGGDQGSDAGGSDLSLALCRGIVEAHGGRLKAEDDGPGQGARFTFTLPAVEAGALPGPLDPAHSAARLRAASPEPVRVLAVDEDPQTLRYVRTVLSTAGYAPIVTGDPTDVPRLMAEAEPHLVLLDPGLSGGAGIELMQALPEMSDVPVILLSVDSEDDVIASAFDIGAADYVVKPFSPAELAARIRVALRRWAETGRAARSQSYVLGDLTIDYRERRVTVAGHGVALTATEFNVLQHLAMAAGQVLTHDQLLHGVWSPGRTGEPWLVRNVVKRLRQKLGDDADDPTYIFTMPRVGYRMPKGQAPNDTMS